MPQLQGKEVDALGGHVLLEQQLQHHQIQRDICLRLPTYLGLAEVLHYTDAIATIPSALSLYLKRFQGMQILTLPFSMDGYAIKQYWHSRVHDNPSHRWLRAICFELFSEA